VNFQFDAEPSSWKLISERPFLARLAHDSHLVVESEGILVVFGETEPGSGVVIMSSNDYN
jgi:hypothetical protein